MSEEVKYLIGISVFLVVFVIPWVVLWRYYKKKPETKEENSFMRDFEARMMMAEMIAETKRQQYQKPHMILQKLYQEKQPARKPLENGRFL